MCKRERLPLERIEGATTLSYLIETDVQLQRVAAISDHLIGTLIEYFHPDVLQLTSGHLMTMQVICHCALVSDGYKISLLSIGHITETICICDRKMRALFDDQFFRAL